MKILFAHLCKRGVNLSSLHHQEEKEMTKLFHIKIQVKETKIGALFDSVSQSNLIAMDLVNKLGLEVHDHPSPYCLVRLFVMDFVCFVCFTCGSIYCLVRLFVMDFVHLLLASLNLHINKERKEHYIHCSSMM
jgi:hypothetical protein